MSTCSLPLHFEALACVGLPTLQRPLVTGGRRDARLGKALESARQVA